MRRALELAKLAWGKTTPNPMVGAVLVRDGKIISEGYHKQDGALHAERDCLKNLDGKSAKGATMYVTLEPCSTHGRTGACTDAIIVAKVTNVKIGTLDPNPAHAGRALEILRSHGINCEYGILEKECFDLNFIFNHNITKNTPLIAIKYAQSKDGKISAKRGEPTQITSGDARAHCMKLRELFSGIAVGYGTLVSDNPSLTARREDEVVARPRRIVFDASLKIADEENPTRYTMFSDLDKANSLVICDANADEAKIDKLLTQSIRAVQMPCPKESPDFWVALRDFLWNEKIYSLIIEGGANLFANICNARVADYAIEYTAPFELGAKALSAFENGKNFDIEGGKIQLGADTLISGNIQWKPKA